MSRICWICKNSEDFFLKQKEGLLENIKKELNDCADFKSKIVDVTKEKLGFSDKAKESVKKIKSEYLTMTLNAVLENKDSFIKLEPALEILIDYFSKYWTWGCTSNLKTVSDVMEKFLQEPVESRYSRELSQNESKEKQLLEKKEALENITTFFIEKEITPYFLDDEFSKLGREPESYDRFYSSNKNVIENEPNKLSFSYQQLGFSFKKKIFICPICLSLFAEAANSSFEIREAQRKALYDTQDWDDDDWDDEDF